MQSRANGMNRERSGEEGVRVPLASLAESRRSDSHSVARRIFFRPRWEPVSRLAGYQLNRPSVDVESFYKEKYKKYTDHQKYCTVSKLQDRNVCD